MSKLSLYILVVLMGICSACHVTKPVRTGTMAFQVKQYSEAVQLLEEELRSENNPSEKGNKAYMLAQSYDILQNYGEALQWYDVADQLLDNEKVTIALAQTLKKNERYKEAEALFREIFSRTKNQTHLIEANICRQAMLAEQSPENCIITPFNANTKNSEYSPVFFEDDFVVFSSDSDNSTGKEVYKWSGREFHDLFIVNSRGRIPQNFDAILNSSNHEGAACFSRDFNEIYFTRCIPIEQGGTFCRIFFSQRPNGFWMEAEPLMFFDKNTNFGQPTLIENDSVLIFSASREGATKDLYYSVRLERGWSEAELMPPSINTEGNENFPVAFEDTLFFASDFHPGYGGYDIFKTYLMADGSWSKPVNLGRPINSGADDFGIAIKRDFIPGNGIILQGLFSSSRNTGFGDDIFAFTLFDKQESEAEPEDTDKEIITKKYKVYLSVRVVEIVYEDGDPNKKIIDRIPLDEARVKLITDTDEDAFFTNKQGRIIKEMGIDESYEILASKLEFLNDSKIINTRFDTPLQKDTTINVELALDRIVYDQEIILNNIYYDFEKWDIREDARPTLDSLSHLLKINPQINIQLSSHTDCRGDDLFNEDLSQKRAQSAVNYLIDSGINGNRLQAKGYGETVPAVACECTECSEEEHQINRRSSFLILRDR